MSRRLLLILCIVFVVLVSGLTYIKLSLISNENFINNKKTQQANFFTSVKMLSVGTPDSNKFVTNLLGQEYLKPTATTGYYVFDQTGNQIITIINSDLTVNKWQKETDWEHQNALILSKWKKDDFRMSVLVFDDLDSTEINSLNKNYGITGLVPKQTLVVVHVTD